MGTSRLLSLLTAALAVANIAHAEGDQSRQNQVPASVQQKVEKLKSDLESKGFEVAQGTWNLFTIDDCKYAIATIGNCLGNNPAAPYVVPTLPLWPNEFADSSMKDMFGKAAGNLSWTYRLDPREAIVVVGLMPPRGAYYGIQSYVFSREGALNANDAIFASLKDPFMRSILFMKSPNAERPLVFSSIGESNNNVVVERQSGGAFDQERSFVITADGVMERQVTEALLQAGVPDRKHIFTEKVSTELVRVGLEQKSDDVMILMRYALPEDEVAGQKWRQDLPMVILRVRDKNTERAVEAFPAPTRDARIAKSELSLKADTEKLVKAVKQKWGQAKANSSGFESLLLKVDLLGPHCLLRPQNCLGDSSDADYQISATFGLDQNDVVAVIGTLGTATGNATYSSLAVNQIPALKGVLNVSHKDLSGSAGSFAKTVKNTDKLYLHYFARDCRGLKNCSEITNEMIPVGDQIKIIQRNYVVPESLRGPDPTQVIEPTLVLLKHRK